MRSISLAFAAVAALLSVAACFGPGLPSPTAADFPDLYSFSTSLINLTGAATIVDAQVGLDGAVIVDSCPPANQTPELDGDLDIVGYDCSAPPAAAVTLATSGPIAPGTHHLVVLLSAISPQAMLNPYQVSGFTITIRRESGAVLKTINLPNATAVLGPGANAGPRTIAYSFGF